MAILKLSKFLNHYKIADSADLHFLETGILIKGNRIKKELKEIIDYSEESGGGLHFEKWLKIRFKNIDGIEETIYIINANWFGFDSMFNGNKKLIEMIKLNVSN